MKKYNMKINGQSYEAQIVEYNKYNAKIMVNGIDFIVEFGEDEEVQQQSVMDGQPTPAISTPIPSPTPANVETRPALSKPVAEPSSAPQDDNVKTIKAPLPGTVSDIKVEVGQAIKINQVVMLLEAMKMESEIYSEYSGHVKNILVTKGQNVSDGQVMIELV